MTNNAIYGWSVTAGSNDAAADSTPGMPEGMNAALVNNRSRGQMARVAAFLDCLGGSASYGGSSNAYTITSPSGHAITSYVDGMVFTLKANHSCTGASTVDVDGLGAKNILRPSGGAMASGDIVSGGKYLLMYDGTQFQCMTPLNSVSYQPLDATLTALAGASTGADLLPYFSGTDTVSTTSLTAAGRALLDDANAAAQRTTLGLVIGTDVQAYDADLAAIAALAVTDSNFIVGNGTTWVAESGSTARTSLGLGTIATQNANAVSLSGGSISGMTSISGADVIGTSDAMLKCNVMELENALDLLMRLQPKRFTWNEMSARQGQRDVGLLAQHVKRVLPEAVKRVDGGYLSLSFLPLIALLIGAVQQLAHDVEDMRNDAPRLRADLNS